MADPNKPEPLKEEFFSTMRIEIPPDLDIHQAESPKNGTAEAKRPPCVERLAEVGAWIQTNRTSIWRNPGP